MTLALSPAVETAIWTQVFSLFGFAAFGLLVWFLGKRARTFLSGFSLAGALDKASAMREAALGEWDRGRARVLWGPVPNKLGGLPELATSADYAVDETGEVERHFATWRVRLDDGTRMVLPVSETVVTFVDCPVCETALGGGHRYENGKCVRSVESTRPAANPIDVALTRVARSTKARPDRPVFACPTCKGTFTKELEAYICSVHDSRAVVERYEDVYDPLKETTYQKPIFKPQFGVDGDCKKCGYPIGLHTGPAPTHGCVLTFPAIDGSGTTRHHVEPHSRTGS